MDTGRGVLNTGVYWGEKGRASGRGRWGGIAWGEMPNVGEGEGLGGGWGPLKSGQRRLEKMLVRAEVQGAPCRSTFGVQTGRC